MSLQKVEFPISNIGHVTAVLFQTASKYLPQIHRPKHVTLRLHT